ncbi:hypothetical protein K492DRAFT_19701 [Lichtheimia hyalospora FSU 10163]|nr:hypothetical protein K492DRAFT_19701 [Lichtheimia hyalospora FSU 10163]
MVSLLYEIANWKHQQDIPPHSIMIPTANSATRRSLLHQQQRQQQQQQQHEQQPNTSTDEVMLASPVSLSYGSESDISLSDDDDESDDDMLLSLSSDSLPKTNNGSDGSLRFYGQRLGTGAIQKKRTGHNVRLQEAHRLEMLKRRLCDLETRNQHLKLKEMTLEKQRDAVAAKEYEDRQRVHQLEEQLKALKESLLTCAYTDK